MNLYTPKQIYCIEQELISHGVSAESMIERAARSLETWIAEYFSKQKKAFPEVLILCGAGNNGSDGYALAPLLSSRGFKVDVFAVNTGKQSTENCFYAAKVSTLIEFPCLTVYDCIIDAVYGSGFHGELSADIQKIFKEINKSGVPVLAVDLPSGVDGEKGCVSQNALCAAETLLLSAPKPGAYIYPGRTNCGQLSLGAPVDCSSLEILFKTTEDLKIPERFSRSNKGTYGTVGIIAGSKNMAGAAYFAAKAAYFCGAGLVKIITEECNRVILQTLLPEAVLYTYTEATPINEILEEVNSCTTAVLGPGLGKKEKQQKLVRAILENCTLPLVLDADGLNLSCGTELIGSYHGQMVITPHPGEVSRLLERTIGDILSNPFDCLEDLKKRYHCTVLLKDAHTLISKDKITYINLTGNNGMATGGCGDVLSGMVAAFLHNNIPEEAAALAAYIHGKAGDFATEKHGTHSVTASRVIENIEEALITQQRSHL